MPAWRCASSVFIVTILNSAKSACRTTDAQIKTQRMSAPRRVVRVEKWHGTYENAVKQVIHAIEYGINTSAQVATFPPHDYLNSTEIILGGLSIADEYVSPLTYDSDFLVRNSDEPIRFRDKVWDLAKSVVLKGRSESEVKRAVVHIQSGDIIANPEALKQNSFMPTSFFASLMGRCITSLGINEVVIITEDTVNSAVKVSVKDAVKDTVKNAIKEMVEVAIKEAVKCAVKGVLDSAADGILELPVEGVLENVVEGAISGAVDGAIEGSVNGAIDGSIDGVVKEAIKGAIKSNVNPLVNALKEQLGDAYPDVSVKVAYSDLSEATKALHAAEVVVLSAGSFCLPLVPFSGSVEHLFLLNSDKCVGSPPGWFADFGNYVLESRGVKVHRIEPTPRMLEYLNEWRDDKHDSGHRLQMMLTTGIDYNFTRVLSVTEPSFVVTSYYTRGAPHDAGSDLTDLALEYECMIASHADHVKFFHKQSLYELVPSADGTAEDETYRFSKNLHELTSYCKPWLRIGMFRWKPHLLLHLASSDADVNEGDIVMYHGVNYKKYPAYVNGISQWREISERLLRECKYDVYAALDGPYKLHQSVKKSLIERCLGKDYYDAHGCWGDLIIFRKSPESRAFLRRWKEMCDDFQNLAPDLPLGEILPGYIHHTHEQAVLSVLVHMMKKDGKLPRAYPFLTLENRDLTKVIPVCD